MPDILNRSGQHNYVCGNKIFILGKFDVSETAELLGNISNMVDKLPWNPVFTTTPLFRESANLTNPYNLDDRYPPVVDVYINSTGGSNTVLSAITAMLNLARARGAIIRTTVLGNAESCGSMLAVQGTPGFRIMYDTSYHFIHYGTSKLIVERLDEIDAKAITTKAYRQKCADIYLTHTNINKKDLQKYMKTEGSGELTPEQSLRHGLCDWILTDDGHFIGRNTKTR